MRMATSTIVPLEEYLHTTYEPECEWIDGVLKAKSMPDGYHGYFEARLIAMLMRNSSWGLRALPEVRTRIAADRFRVPDVMAIPADAPFLPLPKVKPLICIEVLSPDDRQADLEENIDDYVAAGIGAIWIVDPRQRTIAMADANGIHPVDELTLQGTSVRLAATEIFAELDQLEAL
jgi:Uma2 family endonuclease